MNPFIHAKSSVRRYGGVMDDYLDIHNFIDSTKVAMPDHRHRAILHSAFGVFLVERMFGFYRTNSSDKDYSPRQIAEDHIIEDLGFIPTMENYLKNMQLQPWMSGTMRSRSKQSFQKLNRREDTNVQSNQDSDSGL